MSGAYGCMHLSMSIDLRCCPFSLVSFHSASITKLLAASGQTFKQPSVYGSFSPVRELPRHGREREPPGVAPADLAPYLSDRRAGERRKVQGNHADQHTHPPSRATREGTSHWPARRPANQQMQSDGRLRRIRLGLCAAGAYDGGGCAHAPYHSRRVHASRRANSQASKEDRPWYRSRIYSRSLKSWTAMLHGSA